MISAGIHSSSMLDIQHGCYCLKCRVKTGSRDVEQVTLKNGRPALRAVCTVCGTGKYRIGSAV